MRGLVTQGSGVDRTVDPGPTEVPKMAMDLGAGLSTTVGTLGLCSGAL